MALTFAAIVPHSPLLIPAIGKENTSGLLSTIKSLRTINKLMKAAKPETIIILSNHPVDNDSQIKALVFNIHPNYEINFEEFGDYSTRFTVPGDTITAHRLKHRFDTQRESYAVALASQRKLDVSVSAPLFYIYERQLNAHLVTINDTIDDSKLEFHLGNRMRRPIYQDKKKVAVIASVNLSHRLSDKSPAGYLPSAKIFDQHVLEAIVKKRPVNLGRYKSKTLSEVQECALRPLLLLFGILQDTFYTPEILSYESPFGIGHAVINLKL